MGVAPDHKHIPVSGSIAALFAIGIFNGKLLRVFSVPDQCKHLQKGGCGQEVGVAKQTLHTLQRGWIEVMT